MPLLIITIVTARDVALSPGSVPTGRDDHAGGHRHRSRPGDDGARPGTSSPASP